MIQYIAIFLVSHDPSGCRCEASCSFVVCSRNGVSRVGCYCAISIAWDKLKAEGEVDVFRAVSTIKINRPQLVENLVGISISSETWKMAKRSLLACLSLVYLFRNIGDCSHRDLFNGKFYSGKMISLPQNSICFQFFLQLRNFTQKFIFRIIWSPLEYKDLLSSWRDSHYENKMAIKLSRLCNGHWSTDKISMSVFKQPLFYKSHINFIEN